MALEVAKIADAVTMSGTNTITGNAIGLERASSSSFEFAWTGTPTGTLTVEVSNSGENWVNLGVSITGPAGSANQAFVSMVGLPFAAMRFKYVNASGSGALTVWCCIRREE